MGERGTGMTDAPERLAIKMWIDHETDSIMTGVQTEYIRYDEYTSYLSDTKVTYGESCDQIAEYKEQRGRSIQTEYTRTDVAEARIAELEAALRAAEKALHVLGVKFDFYPVAALQARKALKGEDK